MKSLLDFFIEKEVDSNVSPYVEASTAEDAGDFVKAAEIYKKMAAEELNNNLYSFVRYCGLAIMSFLKADLAEKAKEETNSILETFQKGKKLSREDFNPQCLMTIVWDMYDFGFTEEAKLFISQINQKLAENDSPFSIGLKPPKLIKVECPDCKAMFQIALHEDSQCPYCDSVLSEK